MQHMKRALLVTAVVAAAGVAAGAAETPGKGAEAFERLKSLAGEWQSKTPDGTAYKVSYRLVSSGTALMEELEYGGMVTIYHQDGDSLVLTHYCAGNNQPRMRAKPPGADAAAFAFRFEDISNLPDPKGEHMRHMTLRLKDADHVSQQWTFFNGGKEQLETFELTRVK